MKLTIITINKNNNNGLQKTIASVITQTFQDYEYIVIDGVSTDGSVDIIKQYEDKITYWISEPDKGIYNAMNKGILQAKGEYCLFLNSGDYFVNKDILRQIFSYDFSEDIVFGDLKLVKNDKVVHETVYPDKITFEFFFYSSLAHPASLIKRELFVKYGLYNEKNKIVSDWEFFLIMFGRYNASYRHLSLFISCFDTTGVSSVIENQEKLNEERANILKKEFSFFYEDYCNLQQKTYYYNVIHNRRIADRIKDLILYLIRGKNVDKRYF